jgi:hypothetical protein
MSRFMQQPALRLALLTFATILVSGCAEQFATHLVETNWGTPAQMPHRRSTPQTASESSGKTSAGFTWTERKKRTGTWHFTKAMPFCLANAVVAVPEQQQTSAPARTYELLRSRTCHQRAVRTSDYLRERVG